MKRVLTWGLAIALALLPVAAYAAGYYTPGLPTATNPLTGNETIPADTNLASGLTPQSEAVTAAQIVMAPIPVVALTDAATTTLNAASGIYFTWTLGGNRTLSTPTNPPTSKTIRIQITQDATGSRTVTWPGIIKWATPGAPSLSTTAAAIDLVTLVYNGTNWLGSYQSNFK